jgi:hypothetical protein
MCHLFNWDISNIQTGSPCRGRPTLWLACALLGRRFADTLADASARLGANADCYSFIAVDLHHLLFAGFYLRSTIVV